MNWITESAVHVWSFFSFLFDINYFFCLFFFFVCFVFLLFYLKWQYSKRELNGNSLNLLMSSKLTVTAEKTAIGVWLLLFFFKKKGNKQINNKRQEMLTKLVALRMKDTTVLITIRQDDLTAARAQHVTLKNRRCRRRHSIPTRWFGRFVGWWAAWWWWCGASYTLARSFGRSLPQPHSARYYSTPEWKWHQMCSSLAWYVPLVSASLCVYVWVSECAYDALKAHENWAHTQRHKTKQK